MSKRTGTITGVVESKSPKSLVVLVERKEKNQYGKYVKLSTKMHVHDEKSEAGVGDQVNIVPSRPFSKQKTWQLHSIKERSASSKEES